MFGIPPAFLVFVASIVINALWSFGNGAWTILNYRMEKRQDEKLGAIKLWAEDKLESELKEREAIKLRVLKLEGAH